MNRRGPTSSRGPRSTRGDAGEAVRLKPADPFDLIRWLARSQGDPRKAIAELVQNSLDANATHVTVERRRISGVPSILVTDDGDGVLPEMERDEALRHLAQHIGHSRKAKLTPLERRERVIAGKYGVGLLGFWAIGKRFELRSRVKGSKTLALCLVEDEPGGRIVEMPLRTDAPETFTAAVVLDVHETALRSLSGARLASYLGSELRGQLLTRRVNLVVQDGMARGLAQQRFEVKPRRFLGERLDVPADVAVPGYAPMRVELYLARGDASAAVQIACAGTVVAENVGELDGLDLTRAPWMGNELAGVIDFPELNVPPGTRRGIAPDAAAFAFVEALRSLAPAVETELLRYARERERAAHRDLAKELRRALRGLGKRLPQYELPDITARAPGNASHGPENAARESGAPVAQAPSIETPHAGGRPGNDIETDEETGEPIDELEAAQLFAPGPIESVRIVPSPISLHPGRERRVRAEVRDEDGRVVRRPLSYRWTLEGPMVGEIELRGSGARPALRVSPIALASTVAGVLHVAVEGDDDEPILEAHTTIVIEDEDEQALGVDRGIPEPFFESDAHAPWRSRFDGARWIVNDAHEDWVALTGDPKARLRYVLCLFAKDVVARSFAIPGYDEALDRMVEVLAHAERNLRGA